jgi:hypothetical protein
MFSHSTNAASFFSVKMRRLVKLVLAMLLGCIALIGLDRPAEAQDDGAAAKAAVAAALTGKALAQAESTSSSACRPQPALCPRRP